MDKCDAYDFGTSVKEVTHPRYEYQFLNFDISLSPHKIANHLNKFGDVGYSVVTSYRISNVLFFVLMREIGVGFIEQKPEPQPTQAKPDGSFSPIADYLAHCLQRGALEMKNSMGWQTIPSWTALSELPPGLYREVGRGSPIMWQGLKKKKVSPNYRIDADCYAIQFTGTNNVEICSFLGEGGSVSGSPLDNAKDRDIVCIDPHGKAVMLRPNDWLVRYAIKEMPYVFRYTDEEFKALFDTIPSF